METRWDHLINREARLDWRAAALAGLIAGGVMWLFSHGLPWFTSGMISPTLVGRDLKPAGLVDPTWSFLTVLALLGLSVLYALVLAPLVNHFRGMWAVALGGVIGIGLYFTNLAIFRLLLSKDWTGSELPVLVTHFVFGAIAAGLYKGLASRRKRPVERRSASEPV